MKRLPGRRRQRAMEDGASLYLDLLKKCLTRYIFEDGAVTLEEVQTGAAEGVLATKDASDRKASFSKEERAIGRDWPANAETMIGLKRLDNLEQCIVDVLRHRVPGDFIETGVWRGGASILMRGVLRAFQVTDRVVWAADSFRGLPPPDSQLYPKDQDDRHSTFDYLAVPLEEVKENFQRYGLLDEQVRFLVGWFHETLPAASFERLAVARLDGDMYQSTMDALAALYSKISPGGYLIVDDYGAIEGCRAAVDDFRAIHGISETIRWVDWTGIFWQKIR